MLFENKELKTKFEVPDSPTVLQQLNFSNDLILNYRKILLLRNWTASVPLISSWESEFIPDVNSVFETDPENGGKDQIILDKETNPNITRIILWVGNSVSVFMSELENVSKN